MQEWLNIGEGKYFADRTLLVTADRSAVELQDTVIDIYQDRQGVRRLQGQGFVNSLAVIQLLEEHDELDILLDLGADFKYRLVAPTLSGGKIFTPDVKSSMVFVPTRPWIPLTEQDFKEAVAGLAMVAD